MRSMSREVKKVARDERHVISVAEVYSAKGGGVPRRFFFQEEDGIRDTSVTGVQTCALPIFGSSAQSAYSAYLAVDDDNGNLADGTPDCLEIYNAFSTHGIAGTPCAGNSAACVRPNQPKIGRASCRERVEIAVGAESLQRMCN